MRRQAPQLGPAAARLLRAVELRLLGRSLADSALLALAGAIGFVLVSAMGLAYAPGLVSSLAEAAARWTPAVAALAAGAALLPLALRPSRRYLAALVERSCPAMAGSLVLLAEGHPDLDPGVAALAVERADAAAAQAAPRDVLRQESRPRRGAAALAIALGLGLAALLPARVRFLDALAMTVGLEAAEPARFASITPGDVEIEEGQQLVAGCRISGREPESVRAVFASGAGAGTGFGLRRSAPGSWTGSGAPGGPRYWLEADCRGSRLRSAAHAVTVLPRPSARPVAVTCRYPAYTRLAPRTVGSAEVDCLQGSVAEVTVRSAGRVDGIALRLEPEGRRVEARRGADGLWRASFAVERSGSYALLLRPAGGDEREAARAPVTARRDLPPSAAAAVRELPDGRLAVDYRAADDYLLGSAVMAFTVGGRRHLYEVPDAAGRREAQGAVLVPEEVASAAGTAGFRYRLEASDTREPEPNRAASDEMEFRPARRRESPGPLLDPPREQPSTRPPPAAADPSTAGTSVQTTRPLESLYKPDTEPPGAGRPPAAPPPDEGRDPGEFLAPPGEEEAPPPPPPDPKGRPGEDRGGPPREKDGSNGPDDGREPAGQPANVPQPAPAPGPDRTGEDSAGPDPRPGGPGRETGAQPGGERPPTGAETGTRERLPERVLPEQVDMKLRPGEEAVPASGSPAALPTGWGRAPDRSAGRAQPLSPTGGARPDGALRVLRPGAGPGVESPGPAGVAPVAPQYRRYVQEYLRALAEDGP